MAIEDMYVLDHVQSFNGEPIHNIYTYQRSTTGSATDLINAWRDDILDLILQLQAEQIKSESVKAYSLGDLGDLDEQVLDMEGANTAVQMLPVFNAINFSLKPASRAVRPGSKRIAGIPENFQVDGTITDSAYLTNMENVRAAYGVNISDDDLIFWIPVVIKRVLYDVPDSDPVRQAYRFPVSDEELVFATLRAVTTTPKISHQVSRGN